MNSTSSAAVPPSIVYDARYVTAEPTGIGQVCREILRGFAVGGTSGPDPSGSRPEGRSHTGCLLTILINSDTVLPDEVRAARHLRFVDAPWDPRGVANQRKLPRLLRTLGARLYHGMDCYNPVAARGVAMVVTVHDLIPVTCAGLMPRSRKARLLPLWKAWVKLQTARSAAVVAVSRHAASDIERILGVPGEKIRVIYNPVREWGPVEPPESFRRRFGLVGCVLACVGRQDPYKNSAGRVRALPFILCRHAAPLHLVIAGPPDPRYPEAREAAARLGVADRVVFTGWLDDASLGALYRASDVFVFPSLYEGFGMPPLEAMRFGTPVVAGNRTSVPEVLGDAALYVDPEDPAAIADGVLRVLSDAALSARLSEAGRRRAAAFSVPRAAAAYLRLYEDLLPPPRRA